MQSIHTDLAPKAIGTYVQATKKTNLVFLSGQIGIRPDTLELVSHDFTEQCHQALKNLQAVCKASGGDFSDISKLTVYLTDMENYGYVNEVFISYFSETFPARSLIAVKALPKSALVEIDGFMVL